MFPWKCVQSPVWQRMQLYQCIVRLSSIIQHCSICLQQCDVRLLLGTFSPGFQPNSQHTKCRISDFGPGSYVSLAVVKKQFMPSCRNKLELLHSFEMQPRISTLVNMAAWALRARLWRSLELIGDNSSANESNESKAVQRCLEHLSFEDPRVQHLRIQECRQTPKKTSAVRCTTTYTDLSGSHRLL